MNAGPKHEWNVSASRAREIQAELAERVATSGRINNPRRIAGTDISVDRVSGTGTAAVVVLNYPELDIIETRVVADRLEFPYVPGLLSFREAPLIVKAYEKLDSMPDLMMVDGQGIAHPRRIGLASHLGILLDIPTIGCAKSRLCGYHGEPGSERGSRVELRDGDDIIGAVLRTRSGIKPLYISIGHRIDLEEAVIWVLRCGRGYRLPEPTRLAHLAAGGKLNFAASAAVVSYPYQASEDECRN